MIRRCRYFCASLLLVKLSLQQNAMTIEGAFGLAADSASWLATVTGITENCPLVEGITDALNAR